jgi:hypothetical protein
MSELLPARPPAMQLPSLDPPDAELESLLARIQADARRHMTAGPASESELVQLEAAIGHPLPAAFRTFLARLGGGLYYERHEIFGPLRAMIHDIELVPPLVGVCRGLPAGVIPVHRAASVIHFMDLRPEGAASVFSLLTGERHPGFTSFLRDVVVACPGAAGDAA